MARHPIDTTRFAAGWRCTRGHPVEVVPHLDAPLATEIIDTRQATLERERELAAELQPGANSWTIR
jgi:hypothetical protein